VTGFAVTLVVTYSEIDSVYFIAASSDVVKTVTSETETISRRDRDFVIKAETETETWKFETETRDLTFH